MTCSWCAGSGVLSRADGSRVPCSRCATKATPKAKRAAHTRSGVDPARLARALYLSAEPLDTNGWMVSGGSRSHLVRDGACDCDDAAIRRTTCKHVLATRLAVLDREVLDALRHFVGQLVAGPVRQPAGLVEVVR